MSVQFTPPPTYAAVVLYDENAQDVKALLRSVRFNPIWLKWFVDVAQFITQSGGGSGGGVAHNSTTGLQGGTAGEYYHQTSAEHTLYSGTKTANTVLAGPTSGAVATPSFRALVAADLPASVALQTVGTYTVTATGMTTSPTGVVDYSITGNVVNLDIPVISGTSNAGAFTLTGGPAAIRPAADKSFIARVQDNGGAYTYGLGIMKTTGVIELYLTPNAAGFTNAGTKSVRELSVSYTLA